MGEGETGSEEPSILVVDDEDRIGQLLKRILGPGAGVETRSGGRAALQVLEERDFDAVICDLHMPEVSGMQLYNRLRDQGSVAADRIIFLTGGTPDKESREFLETVDNRRIYKPFDFDELQQVLAEVTGREIEL